MQAASLVPTIDRRDGWLLGLIVVLFVASRLLWVDSYLDSSLYWEESYRWISALELMDGPTQPLLDYQADHYQGGSLVMTLLALPLLRIFGKNMIAMKLTAILFSSAMLCMIYVLARRVFGRPTALIAALAYLTGPPLVAYWGVVVMGSHNESVLFSLLQFLVLFELLSGNRRTPAAWALFGLVSGVGLWFCYTSGLGLLACGITWVLLRGLPRGREMVAAVAGTLTGLAPWFVYNVGRGFVGLRRIIEIFGYGDPIDAWEAQGRVEKVMHLVTRDLPLGLLLPFEGASPRGLTTPLIIAFAIPLTVAIVVAFVRAARSLLRAGEDPGNTNGWFEIIFLAYGIVFLAFYLSSPFTVDRSLGAVSYRLFLAPAVLMLIPAARTAATALRPNSSVRRLAMMGCVLYLASSAWGTVLLATRPVDEMSERRDWISIGYTTRGVLLHRKYENDVPRAIAEARLVRDPRLHFRVLRGIGWGLQYRFETRDDLERLDAELASIPPRERFAVLSGLLGFAQIRLRQVGQALVSSDAGPKPGSVALARKLATLIDYADSEWERVPPSLRFTDHMPDPDWVPVAWDFQGQIDQALANGDAKHRFRDLQMLGGRMVTRAEADGSLDGLRAEIESVPLEIRAAILSGIRFFASTRLQRSQEALVRGGRTVGGAAVRSARLARLVEYADVQWAEIPVQYRFQDRAGTAERVRDTGTTRY
jgi:4-amino-4-deoxy-L-arabinose transferase-like glycosyltransferase